MPSMVDMDPVGGIVNICEFLIPYFFTNSFTSSSILFIKKGDLSKASLLYFSKAPLSFAIKADFFTALFNICFEILSHNSIDSDDPSKQLPPAGRGSSAHGFTPSCLKSLSSLSK